MAVKVLHAGAASLRPAGGEVRALSRIAPFRTARILGFDLEAERPYSSASSCRGRACV
ncbi:hypothetical protein ABT158_17625 [Nonomuraea sp. NPDC001636]|uniref:hypothetical protein n=1 Tax=Nonomuraea sp. NPDC001636 TaxID=3154391 RepID=UPI0033291223